MGVWATFFQAAKAGYNDTVRETSPGGVGASKVPPSGAKCGRVSLVSGRIVFRGHRYPILGARASVEVGATQRRTTATRVVAGSVVAPGVGTVVGALAKKKTAKVYLTIELVDGQAIVDAVDAKHESDARRVAAAINAYNG